MIIKKFELEFTKINDKNLPVLYIKWTSPEIRLSGRDI